jgi:hypothetical protein
MRASNARRSAKQVLTGCMVLKIIVGEALKPDRRRLILGY